LKEPIHENKKEEYRRCGHENKDSTSNRRTPFMLIEFVKNGRWLVEGVFGYLVCSLEFEFVKEVYERNNQGKIQYE
jgi:hypothetical protein